MGISVLRCILGKLVVRMEGAKWTSLNIQWQSLILVVLNIWVLLPEIYLVNLCCGLCISVEMQLDQYLNFVWTWTKRNIYVRALCPLEKSTWKEVILLQLREMWHHFLSLTGENKALKLIFLWVYWLMDSSYFNHHSLCFASHSSAIWS
jgi:hypothetical protein